MNRYRLGTLLCALTIPLLVGLIAATISSRAMAAYGSLNKPPLSPPPWVFSLAWTILYLMMGLASYYVVTSDARPAAIRSALFFYALQLIMNFFWTLFFFNWKMYLVAFFWLILMWVFVLICTYKFFAVATVSGILLIPYVLWLTFAGYLNFGAFILNPV